MTPRKAKLYLKNMLDSMRKIEEYTRGLSFEKFLARKMVIDAVIRNLEIIGEAAKNVPATVKSRHGNIPWKEMAGMRDKITHQYFGVDLKIVWKTIRESLPALKKSISKIKLSK